MAGRSTSTFTQLEIGRAINNALVYSKAPAKRGVISDKRLARLQKYAQALLGPLTNEIEEEFLFPEEAVFICLAGALFFQCQLMGTDKLPMGEVSEKLLKGKK